MHFCQDELRFIIAAIPFAGIALAYFKHWRNHGK